MENFGFSPASQESIDLVADLFGDEDVVCFWQWLGVPFPELSNGQFLVLLLMDEHRLDTPEEVKKVICEFLVREETLMPAGRVKNSNEPV